MRRPSGTGPWRKLTKKRSPGTGGAAILGRRLSALPGVQTPPHRGGEERVEPAWALTRRQVAENAADPADRAARMDPLSVYPRPRRRLDSHDAVSRGCRRGSDPARTCAVTSPEGS
ncbi:hypothetical protein GCM10010433_58430 [Streptomyces pulveraceus]